MRYDVVGVIFIAIILLVFIFVPVIPTMILVPILCFGWQIFSTAACCDVISVIFIAVVFITVVFIAIILVAVNFIANLSIGYDAILILFLVYCYGESYFALGYDVM